MSIVRSFSLVALFGTVVASGVLFADRRGVSAQTGGTITGRVAWCSPVPLPMAGGAGGATAPSTPDAAPDGVTRESVSPSASPGEASPSIAPGIYPVPPRPRYIPAGAVLVAAQGTALGTRTSEDGSFQIDGVPADQYLTIAAGPAAGISGAIAMRPNVLVVDGKTVDIGQLLIGQACSVYGGHGYAVPAMPAPEVTPDATPDGAPLPVTP